MNESINETGGTGPSHRSVEIGVAIAIAALGLVSIFGAMQVGTGWGADGPRAGFFPFYVGVVIIISSAINIARIVMSENDGELFASWPQLRQVMAVVVPTTVYVLIIPYIGVYVASALLIALFMKWLGRYSWLIVIPIAVGMPVLTFVTFEIWFLVPLPKGPLENMLGY